MVPLSVLGLALPWAMLAETVGTSDSVWQVNRAPGNICRGHWVYFRILGDIFAAVDRCSSITHIPHTWWKTFLSFGVTRARRY